jgi:diaminohydroxyphosphoribosylaminopyrimidine deaminase/5-amino-6-(5-phosphoribosylamino)uracil reductase
MRLALQAAQKNLFLTHPNPAVGALVCDRNGQILSIAAHRRAGGPHAEVLALQQALASQLDPQAADRLLALEDSAQIHRALCDHHGDRLAGACLYVTLEPCLSVGKTPACAPLIAALGIDQVIIGAGDPNAQMAGGARWLKAQGITVVDAVEKAACEALIAPFEAVQKRGVYCLFKWAQRLSGSIDQGQISGPEALDEVHRIRDVADVLAIGGQTVRTDRPTLDARRIQGRAPDVTILSRRDDFDRSIPLFSVPDRRVQIRPDLSGLKGLVLIEGGPHLLERIYDQLDGLLVYQSGYLSGGLTMGVERRAELHFSDQLGGTLRLFLTPR